MANEQQRPDVRVKREAFLDAQPDLDPSKLVFIDGQTNSFDRRLDQDGAPLWPGGEG